MQFRFTIFSLLLTACCAAFASEAPNVVIILADDLGYGDVGANNPDSKIPTPAMDRVAAEGMRFTDGHSPSAVCTPTRYALLTGRYCWRTRLKRGVLWGIDPSLIDPKRSTIASVLQRKGYRTACVGKWHLGIDFRDKNGKLLKNQPHYQKKPDSVPIDYSKPVGNSPLACDGERFYVNFANGGGAHTTALSRAGKIVWQTKVTDYVVHQAYGSSPAVYKDLLLVTADNKKAGVVAALNRETGEIVWKVKRPQKPNYPSPIVLQVAGREQLVLAGCDLVTSLDPATGKKLWEIPGATTECVTTTVTDGTHVFSSGGWPKNHVSAVRADGSGKIAWRNNVRVYVPSMIVRDGYLYGIADAGIAYCWKSDTGKEMWKGRLGGTFSASLTLVNDRLYAANEAGECFVFKASTKGFNLIAKNQLGDEIFATPVICGNRLYQRVAHRDGLKRQEMLYCIKP